MKNKILHMYYGLLPDKREIVRTLCGQRKRFTHEVIAMLRGEQMCPKCRQEHIRQKLGSIGIIIFPEKPDTPEKQ
ncbi:MAG: hypothetical protein NTY61_01070 [Candidatus Parcubacteria bacterium]|nr:hypothetical protein [Candidatus Parcubacteria bacterium]